jgi:membrane fusion protein (multidrug efflux system)
MKKLIYLPLMISLFACSSDTHEKGVSSDVDVKIASVKVVNPFIKDFTSELKIIGNAFPNKQVKVYAMEGGYLSSIKKDIGDKVRKGEVIAVLQNPELTRKLEVYKVEKGVTKSAYDRLNKVFDKTPALTTVQDLENAEAAYLKAKAQYESMTNKVSYLTIKSPFSGIISDRMVDEGALIQNGISNSNAKPIFEIVDIETIRLVINLPETNVDHIKKGMLAEVSFSDLPGKPYVASVTRMANNINNQSKTMEVQVDIPNKEGRIKGGMYAEVSIQLESSGDKLALPATSLIAIKSEYFLMKVENKKVKRIPIKKGLSNTKYFEVLSDEITKDSQIITEGKGLVKNGTAVNAVLEK